MEAFLQTDLINVYTNILQTSLKETFNIVQLLIQAEVETNSAFHDVVFAWKCHRLSR